MRDVWFDHISVLKSFSDNYEKKFFVRISDFNRIFFSLLLSNSISVFIKK